ncbi:MAG: hypothetical protein ACC707_01700 [Thiohalomonadales bacterium]
MNPAHVRKTEKLAKSDVGKISFEVLARNWQKVYSHGKSESTVSQTTSRIDNPIIPTLGHLPVAEINRKQIMGALKN